MEDNPVIREQLQLLLAGSGYQVETAGDAAAALARMQTFALHLVLLDIGLPVGAAILTGTAAVGCFLVVVQAEIEAYIGFGALAVQLGMTALILFVLLGGYFIGTWALFQRAIEP